jgi:hypothetical protein
MSDTQSTSMLQRLLVGYLVAAKTELDDVQYEKVKALLPGYIVVANEMVTIEVLADKGIMRHAIHSMAADNSVEETLMYTLMLHIFQLTNNSTKHPLEMGIIRQKIIGLLPIFAKARDKGFIRADVYESNESLMMSIANKTEDMPQALAMLATGYEKYAGE